MSGLPGRGGKTHFLHMLPGISVPGRFNPGSQVVAQDKPGEDTLLKEES
jgi:hypothetical protein